MDGSRWIFYITLPCCTDYQRRPDPFSPFLQSSKFHIPAGACEDAQPSAIITCQRSTQWPDQWGQIKQTMILSLNHCRHTTWEPPGNRAFASAPWVCPELEKCGPKAEVKFTQMHTDHFYGGCFLARLRDLTRTCPKKIIVRLRFVVLLLSCCCRSFSSGIIKMRYSLSHGWENILNW